MGETSVGLRAAFGGTGRSGSGIRRQGTRSGQVVSHLPGAREHLVLTLSLARPGDALLAVGHALQHLHLGHLVGQQRVLGADAGLDFLHRIWSVVALIWPISDWICDRRPAADFIASWSRPFCWYGCASAAWQLVRASPARSMQL